MLPVSPLISLAPACTTTNLARNASMKSTVLVATTAELSAARAVAVQYERRDADTFDAGILPSRLLVHFSLQPG